MTAAAVYSPGRRGDVILGEGQLRFLAVLRELEGRRRHKSRHWFELPPFRAWDRAASTVWQYLDRIRALGVVMVQATLGRDGFVRVTFGVPPWHPYPFRRGMLARFTVAPGQLAFMPPEEPEPDEPLSPGAGEPHPPSSPAPIPIDRPRAERERYRTPQRSDTHITPPAGFVAPHGTFAELMAKHGFRGFGPKE
jgi:hypothetical protein